MTEHMRSPSVPKRLRTWWRGEHIHNFAHDMFFVDTLGAKYKNGASDVRKWGSDTAMLVCRCECNDSRVVHVVRDQVWATDA